MSRYVIDSEIGEVAYGFDKSTSQYFLQVYNMVGFDWGEDGPFVDIEGRSAIFKFLDENPAVVLPEKQLHPLFMDLPF